jgi:hypothetical protein
MIDMSNNKSSGSPARDSAEWNGAWATVSKLAAARQVALRGLTATPANPPDESPASDAPHDVDEASTHPSPTIDQGHFENAIAEIEEASAALKSASPALEAWQPETPAGESETRKPRSVWLLIGTIWLTMALAIAGVIKAVGYLLG